MKFYIVEYKFLVDMDRGIWASAISSDGFKTLKAAQEYIEAKDDSPIKRSDYQYDVSIFNSYYIREILIKE